MKKKIVSVILLIVLVYLVYAVPKIFGKSGGFEDGLVVKKVIDGDTIELSNGKFVRLIGINAPEKNENYYLESKSQLEKIEGREVRLEKDKSNKDKYGRLLRYVFLENHFVNLELVSYGYAKAMVMKPNVKYEGNFFEAEKLAKKSELGIWKK